MCKKFSSGEHDEELEQYLERSKKRKSEKRRLELERKEERLKKGNTIPEMLHAIYDSDQFETWTDVAAALDTDEIKLDVSYSAIRAYKNGERDPLPPYKSAILNLYGKVVSNR